MSYWVSLEGEAGQVKKVPSFEEGGTYALGGSDEASLNITYNYSESYRLVPFDLNDLHGRQASQTVVMLEEAIEKLGTRRYAKDYWAPTPGNAGYALSILLGWARQHPDGVWSVE